ncbi:MAG: hydantoinase B/oxoprolinase family protein, partial [Rhodospirillaceae bacterium]|nr:hydantoinase B/oxoprolinase family protein [Rhodospirillaceae bacterium]
GRAAQYIRHANGETETLEPCAQVPVRAGETIVSLSCGGGGFGSPLERPLAEVASDVREKWISGEAAAAVYGVVLGANGEADIAASEKQRRELASGAN